MNASRRWAIGAAAGIFFACAHGPSAAKSGGEGEPSPPASRYYPLRVGRSWTYQAAMLGEKRVVTVAIEKEEGGFFVDNQGGRLRSDSVGIRDAQRYLLQNPVREGHSWTNVVSRNVAEHYTIEAVATPCQVPAGRFDDCVVVESRSRVGATEAMLVNRMTFASEIGLVHSEVTLVQAGKRTPQSALALQSYLDR